MRFDPRKLDAAQIKGRKGVERAARGNKPPHAYARDDIRAHLVARVLYMRNANEGKPLTYTKFHTGGAIESTVCKLTGELLQGLIPHENGKYLIQAYSSTMRHLKILFDDGSAHVTGISLTGLNLIKSLSPDQQLATLEYLYCCDISQWLEEEGRGFGQLKDSLVAFRDPVGFEEEIL